MRFWPIIGNGVIAGIAAGLVFAILILTFTTPLILKAEKYEHQKSSEHVSDDVYSQRNLGTLIGTTIISIVYGLVLAAIFGLIAPNPKKPVIVGLMFGLLGYLIVILVPSIAFLPNPPGIEMQASASTRQLWWLAIIVSEAAGLLLYFAAVRFTKASKTVKHLIGLIALSACVAVPFSIGIPNAIAESIIPASLLFDYRITSLLTTFTFWLILGATTGLLFTKFKVSNLRPN